MENKSAAFVFGGSQVVARFFDQIKSLCKTYFQSERKNNGLTGNKKFILRSFYGM